MNCDMQTLGDPCSISSQDELNEAIRLFDVNKEAQLILHGRHLQCAFKHIPKHIIVFLQAK